MKCAICHRPGPADLDAVIEAGWIPYYFVGQREMPGPVCPECCEKHLRLAKDEEWETKVPPPDAYRWN